ncbi:MAG: SCO family protein [Rhodospirillales bacterium]|nr:SCO family protein [Rhodospirillales bacterium]MDE2577131.1 SCO family protein [Rhodospirillales bacterium]
MIRHARWLAIGLVAVVLGASATLWLRHGPGAPAVSVGGPFTLTDGAGKTVTNADFRGRWMLVYFGYTYCPDVCPTELQTIAAALDQLGQLADRVAPLFITVDPGRDTPGVMASYVKLFSPRLIGLTGTDAQISAAAHAYRVYYQKVTPKDSTGYLMDHSSFIYLMGPDGRFRSLYGPGTSADALAKAIRARIGGAASLAPRHRPMDAAWRHETMIGARRG